MYPVIMGCPEMFSDLILLLYLTHCEAQRHDVVDGAPFQGLEPSVGEAGKNENRTQKLETLLMTLF